MISCGCSPYEEDCLQVGKASSTEIRKEVSRYRDALIQTCGEPPEGVRLVVQREDHDFGVYYELVAKFPDNPTEEQIDYALKCEQGIAKWPV